MEIQEVEVFIDDKGGIQMQVRGAQGTSCLDITRPLEEALGGVIEHREMTAEALVGEKEGTEGQAWLKQHRT